MSLKKKGDKLNSLTEELFQEDEIISSTFEEVIILWCLERIDPSLPNLVYNSFWVHLTEGGAMLKDLRSEIFEVRR